MRSKSWVRSIRCSPEVVVTGTIGDRRMAQCQRGRREDRGRRPGIALTGEDVENDIGGMNAVSDRFRTSRLDRRQPVGEHRGEAGGPCRAIRDRRHPRRSDWMNGIAVGSSALLLWRPPRTSKQGVASPPIPRGRGRRVKHRGLSMRSCSGRKNLDKNSGEQTSAWLDCSGTHERRHGPPDGRRWPFGLERVFTVSGLQGDTSSMAASERPA